MTEGKSLYTPEQVSRAEREHQHCLNRWHDEAEKDPERLFTLHDVNAHLPPDTIHDLREAKPDIAHAQDVADMVDLDAFDD